MTHLEKIIKDVKIMSMSDDKELLESLIACFVVSEFPALTEVKSNISISFKEKVTENGINYDIYINGPLEKEFELKYPEYYI